MLLDTKPALEDQIVTVLAARPGLAVGEIAALVRRHFAGCSESSVYQELRKLRERTVVSKSGKNYSLRLGWIRQWADLAATASERHLQSGEVAKLIPEEGGREVWRFSTLHDLGRFWTQLLLTLCQVSVTKRCFEWAPHAWFAVSHSDEEAQFLEAMKAFGHEYYLIIGNESALDREYARKLKGVRGEVSFAESPFDGMDSVHYSLIDEYLITVRLPLLMVERIDELFGGSGQVTLATVKNAVRLFRTRTNVTLSLERRPAKSKRIAKAFEEFFGVRALPRAGSSK